MDPNFGHYLRPGTLGIYRWFGENLHRVRDPSLRHYVRARELKAAGMDWTAVLAAEDENPREACRRAFGE